jgi:LacI family transcriptional regulator
MTGISLRAAGRVAAWYHRGSDLPRGVSPRPYLHPIHTPGGTVVTAVEPHDHPHHLGLSFAVPDVAGVSFWGGRTFVRDVGSTWLDNHGSQRRLALVETASGLRETLEWRGPAEQLVADEERELVVESIGPGTAVRWRSVLRVQGRTRVASPAVNGRQGAGYGGLFWRFPAWTGRAVMVAEGEGEAVAHGSTSPWLAISGADGDGRSASVLLAQPGPALPWFVRAGEYLGAGPALAWEHARDLPAGGALACALDALVLDGPIDDPAALAALLG